jgi:transcriptional regulator with XRE-family HTH domain
MTTQKDWPARLTGSIAAEVRRQRKARGMSAQQVADECTRLGVDLPRNTIADLENGRRASLSVAELLALARALDVPPLLLVFPADAEAEAEILPGATRPTWRALQWASGEGPFPGAEDADLLTIAGPWNSGPAAALALYRLHDDAVEEELRAEVRAADLRKLAASAAGGVERQALEMAAEATGRRAIECHASAERLRGEAAARGWRPPETVRRFVIPAATDATPERSTAT